MHDRLQCQGDAGVNEAKSPLARLPAPANPHGHALILTHTRVSASAQPLAPVVRGQLLPRCTGTARTRRRGRR